MLGALFPAAADSFLCRLLQHTVSHSLKSAWFTSIPLCISNLLPYITHSHHLFLDTWQVFFLSDNTHNLFLYNFHVLHINNHSDQVTSQLFSFVSSFIFTCGLATPSPHCPGHLLDLFSPKNCSVSAM